MFIYEIYKNKMFDEFEIPQETEDAVNFNTLNEIQKIASIARSRTLVNNQASYVWNN